MALRNIRVEGDPILGKKCKTVPEMTERINDLIDDMFETMYEAQGVGLAAPQVGVLKRIVTIDVSAEGDSPLCLINPVIESISEEIQTGWEGCLSVPGKSGIVTRAMKVKVRYQDRNMQPMEIEGEGLLARALQHEIDHLDGLLYVRLAEDGLVDNSELEEE